MQDATKSATGEHAHQPSDNHLYAYVFLDEQGAEHLMGVTSPDGTLTPMVSHCRPCMEGMMNQAEAVAATGVTVKFVEYRHRRVIHVCGTAGQA